MEASTEAVLSELVAELGRLGAVVARVAAGLELELQRQRETLDELLAGVTDGQ